MSIAYPESLEQRLLDLGNIPLSRVLMQPPPGTATIADWIAVRNNEKRLCELIDGTLVEKPMGWLESMLATVLIQLLRNYVDASKSGVVTGADGFTELFDGTVRGPDVAYIAWDRLPQGRLPTTPVPSLVPNFVIEVLSAGNTYSEMSRKRREYFCAGVELVWMVDHRNRTITVYRSSQHFQIVQEGDSIDGSPVLPGWSFNTADLFAKLDEHPSRG
jgi:Uma2 family endonuclease